MNIVKIKREFMVKKDPEKEHSAYVFPDKPTELEAIIVGHTYGWGPKDKFPIYVYIRNGLLHIEKTVQECGSVSCRNDRITTCFDLKEVDQITEFIKQKGRV